MTTAVSNCETCNGYGWATVVAEELSQMTGETVEVERVQHCTDCSYWEMKRGEVPGMPDELKAITQDDVEKTPGNEAAYLRAGEFVSGIHPDLYLWGGTGRGKTYLAAAIANDLYRMGTRTRFVRAQELLLQLRGENDQEVFDQITQVPLLVLDDLGAFQGTEYARAKMQLIYDKRTDYNNRTIFTANLSLMHLLDFLDDNRLPSRIAGRAMVVEITGDDWRLRRKRKKRR